MLCFAFPNAVSLHSVLHVMVCGQHQSADLVESQGQGLEQLLPTTESAEGRHHEGNGSAFPVSPPGQLGMTKQGPHANA